MLYLDKKKFLDYLKKVVLSYKFIIILLRLDSIDKILYKYIFRLP